MGTFLGIHDKGASVTDDEAVASWTAYKTAATAMGCTPKHSHYSAEKGKGFCVTEANSAEEVQKAHDNAKVPVNEIYEIKDLQ